MFQRPLRPGFRAAPIFGRRPMRNPVPPAPLSGATSLALSVAVASGPNNTAVTVTVTPNDVAGGAIVATLSLSGGGTLGSSTLSWSLGESGAKTTTITRTSDGTSTITLTNSAGLSNTGTPATFTSFSFVRGVHDGDSITSFAYPSDPSRWGLPGLTCPPQMLANFGVPSDTLTLLLARISTTIAYANAVNAKCVLLRIGTNGVGTGDFATKFAQILDTYIAGGIFVFVTAIPPKTGTDMRSANALEIAACAARPLTTLFVEDCDGLGDASYVADATCFIDGIHPNAKGQYIAGTAQSPLIAPYFITDPLVKDSTAAAAQWVQAALMTGTAGTKVNGSGTVPTGINVEAIGSGTTFTASIVAADVGDTNTVPWLDLDVTMGASGSIEVRCAMTHPSIAADFSAVRTVDTVMQVKLVGLDTTNLDYIQVGPDSARTYIQSAPKTRLTGNGTLNRTLVMRSAYERGGPNAYSANTLKAMLIIASVGATGGSAGHIRMRCPSAVGTL